MHCARQLLAIAFLLTVAAAAFAQPELVVVTERTKQYHRPSCPLVREGKIEVTAMTVGQAEARGFRAHPVCDSSNPANKQAQSASEPGSSSDRQAPVYVFTAAGDTRYHRETCAKLPKERKKVLLEEAGKKLWPCPVCRPPIRKRTPAVPKR